MEGLDNNTFPRVCYGLCVSYVYTCMYVCMYACKYYTPSDTLTHLSDGEEGKMPEGEYIEPGAVAGCLIKCLRWHIGCRPRNPG